MIWHEVDDGFVGRFVVDAARFVAADSGVDAFENEDHFASEYAVDSRSVADDEMFAFDPFVADEFADLINLELASQLSDGSIYRERR